MDSKKMKNKSSKQPFVSLPPPELLFQVSRDSDPENFLRSSAHQVAALFENLSECNLDFDQPLRFLDFGCGVGKILVKLQEYEHLDLHGCDIDGKVIGWCTENLRASCYQNNLLPPLKYPNNYFDVINAISVFTHLSLEMQIRWAWELYRILKPGGYLHFTVHGPAYFGLFAHVAKTRTITNLKLHSFDDTEIFMELEQPIHSELYTPKKGLDSQGQLEVAVAHTESMVRKIFSAFLIEKRIEQGSIGSGHDAFVVRKPIVGANALLSPFAVTEKIVDKLGTMWSIDFDLSNFVSSEESTLLFRIFCTGGAPGIYITKVGSVIRILNNNDVITEERPMLSKGCRLFGDTQWSTIDIIVPLVILNGKMSIEIETVPSDISYLKDIKWLAPQILLRSR